MIKKIFNISGFDCPNCAAKAERHLSTQEGVDFVHLDFASNKLYISFSGNAWDVKKLRSVIAEVEDAELQISEGKSASEKQPIFTRKMKFMIFRIVFSIAIILICMFALAKPELNWLRFGLYAGMVVVIGYDIFGKVFLHLKNRANVLDHNLLISIAALGSLTLALIDLLMKEEVIHNGIAFDDSMESVMVITLFQIGSIIENIATNKSKAAISSAISLRVDTANLLTNEGIKVEIFMKYKNILEDLESVSPETLTLEDKILINAGELIPIDGEVIEGTGYIDTSSLTGEYVPVLANVNDSVYSGCLLKEGQLTVSVKKKYADSTISKIIDLIEKGGEKKSKADEFIARFAKIYTPIVVILSILTLVIGGLVAQLTGAKDPWLTWVHTGLEILVIGCPCAIVISVPLAYFSAIGLASKHGVVVKGGNYLDKLQTVGKLITDKTGTLTHGSFTLQTVNNIGIDYDEFMKYLLSIEALSAHPIGKAITHDFKKKKFINVKSFNETPGVGCSGYIEGKYVLAGSERLMSQNKIKFEASKESGSIVYLAIDNQYVGYVILSDTIKEDAQPMVDLLHSIGVEIVLLTGDKENNTKDICNKLGIDRWHSELLPEQKTLILEDEMRDYRKSVAFIGDGINDAPSIIRSDIGIAMGGIGSDVAVDNADVIIMNDDPAKVYDTIKIAKMGRHTALFNICFALLIKLAVFVLALIFHDESFMMYVAIGADTGLTVLLVLNSLLLLYRPVSRKVK
mgnify:CR=1 FL=1